MTKRFIYLIIFACALTLACPNTAKAAEPADVSYANEKLAYNVYFHMGFIWAKAGYGELAFNKQNAKNGTTHYHAHLTAQSLNVVEHVMKVRDTIDSWFNAEMLPTEFRKGTHEGSYNSIAHYNYSPYLHKKNAASTQSNVDSTKVTITRWRKKGKNAPTFKAYNFSNKGASYDMLSLFYSIRNLNYATMAKGKKMEFICYDGVERLPISVEYRGIDTCQLRSGKKFECYRIYLSFSTKGQDDTPLEVWMTKTADRVPVKAVIALMRIGSVQCEIIE